MDGKLDNCNENEMGEEDHHSSDTQSEFNYIASNDDEWEENKEEKEEMANNIDGQIMKQKQQLGTFWDGKLEEMFNAKFEEMKHSILENIAHPVPAEMFQLNGIDEKINELEEEIMHHMELFQQNTKSLEAFFRGQQSLRKEIGELRKKLENMEKLMEQSNKIETSMEHSNSTAIDNFGKKKENSQNKLIIVGCIIICILICLIIFRY